MQYFRAQSCAYDNDVTQPKTPLADFTSPTISTRLDMAKVFCNFIGWVKSANGQNSWMTSLSYARDRAQKVLINPAELLTYSQRQFGKKN